LVRPLVDGVPIFQRIGEAIESARHSVWLTVAFCGSDFRFPDGRGALFEVLDRAVGRGLEVRVIFWRTNPESSRYGRAFPGSPADRDLLRERGSRFRIRWDRAAGAFCQHQKSWVIDAGWPSESAFVGGVNLTAAALGSPGDAGGGQRHDAYVEVAGPSATDVNHNFVQRWNEASERWRADGNWGCDGEDELPFPTRLSEQRGTSTVQIQRMLHPGRYADGHPTPGGTPFDVAAGERSILEQYQLAVDAARRTVYVENQAVPIPLIADRLDRALGRGVDVVLLVPAIPEDHVFAARLDPKQKALFDGLERLGRHHNFLLAGIAGRAAGGGRAATYVHAKLMLVDDCWATIGSCNLHSNSLSGHSELNVSIWDRTVVRDLRCTLLAEHLGENTAGLDDRAAFRLYRFVARERPQKRKPRVRLAGSCFRLVAEQLRRQRCRGIITTGVQSRLTASATAATATASSATARSVGASAGAASSAGRRLRPVIMGRTRSCRLSTA
jgi:phosphatidylserine/phosphatidylglycerophosphate/cardiolipin synthase-like enzyme